MSHAPSASHQKLRLSSLSIHRVRAILIAPVVLALAAVLAPGTARAAGPDDIEVSVETPLPGGSDRGYAEYTFVVTNHSPDQAHQVEIRLPAKPVDSYYSQLRKLSRQVRVEPGGRVKIHLYQPDLRVSGNDAAVLVDGRPKKGQLLVTLRHDSMYSSPANRPTVLIGRQASEADLPAELVERVFVVELEDQTWSRSWLALSQYTVVVLHRLDYERLPAPSREALWDWVQLGGSLLLLGTQQPPADAPPASSAAGVQPVGTDGTSTLALGLGTCLVSPARWVAEMSEAGQQVLEQDGQRAWAPVARLEDYSDTSMGLLAVDGFGFPVRALFALILGFAVLIGPVNLLVLRRYGRRLWLLWTIPAISVLTTAGLLVFALVAEGWTPILRSDALTLLDQRQGRAFTIGVLGIYAPVMPSDGLHAPASAELTINERWSGPSGSGRQLDWTTDQHLARGWLEPRTPAAFAWRDAASRSERLTVHAEGAGIEIGNGLGVPITEPWVAGTDGRVFSGRQIAAGAAARLEPEPWTASGRLSGLAEVYSSGWATASAKTGSIRTTLLEPGTYLAMVERSPFLSLDMPRARWQRCSGAVLGRYADPPGPAPATTRQVIGGAP
jgi:hypothetical protein